MFEELKRRNVIRVAVAYLAAAWLVIQVVETLFPVFEFSNEAIRVVVIIFAIGFPVAVVLAWFYEVTPDGIERDGDAHHDDDGSRKRARRFDRAVVAVLVLAVVFFAVDKFVLDPTRDAETEQQIAERARDDAIAEIRSGNRIAVLPFVNRSGDPDDEYLADGFSDDLIHLLSRDEQLFILSSRSSFAFKNTNFTIPEIAGKLNASYIVDGSIQVSDDEIQVTAYLVDAVSDTPLWTRPYRVSTSAWYEMQNQISAAIFDALRTELSLTGAPVAAAAATQNDKAHKAYLLGRHLVAQRRPDLLPAAIRSLREAVELDPGYVLGFAELAIALMGQGCDDQLEKDCEAESLVHARHALALDPDLPEANLAMSLQFPFSESEQSLRYVHKALEGNPGYAEAYAELAEIYIRLPFRVEERISALERALTYDPMSRRANVQYVFSLLERGMTEEARAHIDTYAAVDPNHAMVLRGELRSMDGHNSEFILAMLEASRGGIYSIPFGRSLDNDLNHQLIAIGLAEEALRRIDPPNIELTAFFGNLDEAVALARVQVTDDTDSFIRQKRAGFVLAHAGYYEEARPLLEFVWQRMSGVARNDSNTAYVIEALYWMRSRDGDTTGAAEILLSANEGIRRFHDAGMIFTHQIYYSTDYLEGIVRYLEGNHDEAVPMLMRAADSGFDIPPPSPFQLMRVNDPRYAIVYEHDAERKNRERAKVLAVTCADGFEHPVWTPMPETCERYGLR